MLPRNLVEELEDLILFTLKYHMFDNIVEDVSRFGALCISDTSPFEYFKYVIQKFIKMTSLKRGKTLEETFDMMDLLARNKESRNNNGGGIGNVRDGIFINLVEITSSTLAPLAHIDNDGRCFLASQCLNIVQNSFQFVGHRFFLVMCT